mmetsp:Transcript_124311/g.362986  ORF Transcript_124311/g.362986 Transcript_124311/m.362986 type:complete len:107 (-) Transcript_124311:1581-1901(-)
MLCSLLMSWSWSPSSARTPSEITAILSAFRTVERRWAMTNVVRRLERSNSSRAACTTFSDTVSKADVASSKIRMAGSRTTARAMAMRCFWPPESCTPLSPTGVSKP